MKLFFDFTSNKKYFGYVIALFILNSIYMLYCIVQIFFIHPKIPDLEILGYSTQKLTGIFEAFGVQGLYLYKKLQIGDLFYPITVFLFSGSVLYKTFQERGKPIYFIPLLYLISDYVENYFLWSLRDSYPYLEASKVRFASTFSVIKHSSLLFMFTLYISKHFKFRIIK